MAEGGRGVSAGVLAVQQPGRRGQGGRRTHLCSSHRAELPRTLHQGLNHPPRPHRSLLRLPPTSLLFITSYWGQIQLAGLPEGSREMGPPCSPPRPEPDPFPRGSAPAGCVPLPGDFEEARGRSSSGWIRRAGYRRIAIYSLLELSRGGRAGT